MTIDGDGMEIEQQHDMEHDSGTRKEGNQYSPGTVVEPGDDADQMQVAAKVQEVDCGGEQRREAQDQHGETLPPCE